MHPGLNYPGLVAKTRRALSQIRPVGLVGRVAKVVGLTVESQGPAAALGEACWIYCGASQKRRLAEVVGFREGRILLMPWEGLEGIGIGDGVQSTGAPPQIPVGPSVLGRILDPLGRPIDDLGPLPAETPTAPLIRSVPPPARRPRISNIFQTGVRAIDSFATAGAGQRLGIFAGSGVGKSTLLGMICRYASADINVIALIGERGREVLEFVERDLGPEALKRSVIVVATSDQPALARIKAAFTANTIAAHFRAQGKHVLLMMDSLTRLAMAQREIGLAVGEPPATRGYPPSVFGLMPILLEQAGCLDQGIITGFYTVLTEGDDWNDPISDCARSILDGHLLLTRRLASENHYPAIDVLESLSRLQSNLIGAPQRELIGRARHILAVQRQYRELVEIGAYTPGSNTQLDHALALYPQLVQFLRQSVEEPGTVNGAFAVLERILNSQGGGAAPVVSSSSAALARN
ncbi:MAG: FliI/YscN family ATPase [Verrucomicrobium sp.]|nr:FliI/YscN family ATPase [Verrucomicrobium sp.]